jgi:DNA-binding beta-propeller fold protein YncE
MQALSTKSRLDIARLARATSTATRTVNKMRDAAAVETYEFELVEGWGELPTGWSFKEVAAVATDSKDQVYVFSRGDHPVIVFDRDGKFLRSWGEGQFARPHGMHIAGDTLYLTDDLLHVVRKCSLDGKILLEIGIPGKPAPYMSGEPFHRCTHTALSPQGDIYVTDGYGNARVHKFAPDGRLLLSWGEPGSDPGEFNIVHNICCDGDGWVYVADRENHRVQVFDGSGRYETQWNNLHRPCGLYMTQGPCPICYIGELGPVMGVNRNVPNLGPRLTIVDAKGKRLARVGGRHAGLGRGEFIAPHGIAVDSHGDVYVGEVSYTIWPDLFANEPRPAGLRSLQKFRRVRSANA